MLFLRSENIKNYTSIPLVWMVFILLLGFVIGAGHIDTLAIKEGQSDVTGSAKMVRAVSVGIVFVIAFFTLIRTNTLNYIVRGSSAWLFIFFLLCVASTVFSPVKSYTLYKSFEIFTVLLMLTTVYAVKDRYQFSKKYIAALFFFYTLTVLGVYFQFAIFGSEGQRQLVGVTPLFGFMLTSKYPGMVGNALGYLGAVVALYGIFLLSTTDTLNKSRRIIGITVFLLGSGVTFFSYTRSIMIFLFIAVFLYAAYRKKYVTNLLMIFLLIIPLGMPQVRDKIVDHMRRGASDEAISSMSGRTEMWAAVFDRRIIKVIIGSGYATGSKFMNFEKTGTMLRQANVHNGFLEVVMSVGVIGGVVWLGLLTRICFQFYSFYKHTKFKLSLQERNFHVFMMALLFLSLTRSIMNSTFVYLDYFYPILMGFAIYGDSLRGRLEELRTPNENIRKVDAIDNLSKRSKDDFAKRSPQILMAAKK